MNKWKQSTAAQTLKDWYLPTIGSVEAEPKVDD